MSRSEAFLNFTRKLSQFSHSLQGRTTRLAPAPTGKIHAGHVIHCLYVFGIAKAYNMRVVLRMEDHDSYRSKDEYAVSIIRDLKWLGFPVDDYSKWLKQSERLEQYRLNTLKLSENENVFFCDCSRRKLLARIGVHKQGKETAYDGHCRKFHADDIRMENRALRVEIPRQDISFMDITHGSITQTPADQCGDLLIRDSRGDWTYQFAVSVDDKDQGIDMIIRGEDILPSTGRQIQLARMLGRKSDPFFLHHPLIYGTDSSEKLSKRSGAHPVEEMRNSGLSKEQILGSVAFSGGIVKENHEITLDELLSYFDTNSYK